MAKFLQFWFYSIIGIALYQLIRVLFGEDISIDTVIAHLWFGITTTAIYHWYLTKDEKASDQ